MQNLDDIKLKLKVLKLIKPKNNKIYQKLNNIFKYSKCFNNFV